MAGVPLSRTHGELARAAACFPMSDLSKAPR